MGFASQTCVGFVPCWICNYMFTAFQCLLQRLLAQKFSLWLTSLVCIYPNRTCQLKGVGVSLRAVNILLLPVIEGFMCCFLSQCTQIWPTHMKASCWPFLGASEQVGKRSCRQFSHLLLTPKFRQADTPPCLILILAQLLWDLGCSPRAGMEQWFGSWT